HALSTVANGGFSTYDDSIMHFQSPAIIMVCTVFMVLAAINFSLHFLVWREKSLRRYLEDAELRFFLGWIIVGSIITVAYLAGSRTYGFGDSAYVGIFNFVS